MPVTVTNKSSDEVWRVLISQQKIGAHHDCIVKFSRSHLRLPPFPLQQISAYFLVSIVTSVSSLIFVAHRRKQAANILAFYRPVCSDVAFRSLRN